MLDTHPQPESFSAGLYELFGRCLQYRPEDRPAMPEVEETLQVLAQPVKTVDISQAEYQ